MTDLSKLRDEMAEAHSDREYSKTSSNADIVCCREDFKTGWSALLKILEQEAGEFDLRQAECEAYAILPVGVSMLKTVNEDLGRQIIKACIYVARRQFEQHRARINLNKNLAMAAYDKIKQLEARLEESELKLSIAEKASCNLADKLTASERREREAIADLLRMSEKLTASEAKLLDCSKGYNILKGMVE